MATNISAKSVPSSHNSRINEIVAIGLLAIGILMLLSLVSYRADDPSWNSTGSTEIKNLVGTVGANIAATLFQIVGLAAYLIPPLLLAAAWRRFFTRSIQAPLFRVIGLVILVLSASALLTISGIKPLFDASVQPGGLIGSVVAYLLVNILNTVGASILLLAVAATGLLLATNFSFANILGRAESAVSNNLSFLHTIPVQFKDWRAQSKERQKVEDVKPKEPRETEKKRKSKTASERVAEFMNEPAPTLDQPSKEMEAEKPVELPTIEQPTTPPPVPAIAKRTQVEKPLPKTEIEDDLATMMEDVAVVRVDLDGTPEDNPFALEDQDQPVTKPRKPETRITDYKLPEVAFMNAPPPHREQADEELLDIAAKVAEKCKEFNVTGQIKHICPGPVVTTYEFKPDPGVKYSRVTGLVDDLCLALKAESIRIDRLPGKPHVGIEVPNPHRETIYLREVIESRQFRESQSKLTIALGKTIDGLNYVADLARMPHLLIAGSTGSGKSVCVNSLVVSILYKASPDEVKFIMVDPKRLELGLYADIPHLAAPIITEPKRAAYSLKWAVSEMERRYKDLAGYGVRNIDGFNTEIARRNSAGELDENGEPWKPLPYIVIIIDELADLMMTASADVEESITRLAQMARAVGIHLVLATQRPSVDVITGLIKANFPSRIAFRVSSKVDSRTIIDANGSEQLLGRGDMLFLPPGTSRLVRVHGGYIDENEVARIVNHIKAQGAPVYDNTITESTEETEDGEGMAGERDEVFNDALRICVEMKRASTSVLQRRLRIGYGRAAAILDAMERAGYIGPADGSRPRPVLSKAYETVSHWDDLTTE
jgi:DNA segregation ATPase FtsK/SpoIIIE, S-DNA-T family